MIAQVEPGREPPGEVARVDRAVMPTPGKAPPAASRAAPYQDIAGKQTRCFPATLGLGAARFASLSYFDGRENGPAGRLEARTIGADFLGFLRPSQAVMPPISRSPRKRAGF